MNSSRRPSLLWRLFVIGGVGTATAVTVSDAAWDRWKSTFGDALPREAFRNIAVGTAGLHAVEAGAALFSARRAGLEKPGRWAFGTLIWGFPVLRRLRKAKKAGNAPVQLAAPTEHTRPTTSTKSAKRAKAEKPTKPTKPTKATKAEKPSKRAKAEQPAKRSTAKKAARAAKITAAAAAAAKKAA